MILESQYLSQGNIVLSPSPDISSKLQRFKSLSAGSQQILIDNLKQNAASRATGFGQAAEKYAADIASALYVSGYNFYQINQAVQIGSGNNQCSIGGPNFEFADCIGIPNNGTFLDYNQSSSLLYNRSKYIGFNPFVNLFENSLSSTNS